MIMYYWEMGKRLNKEYGLPKQKGENLGRHVRATHEKAVFTEDSRRQLIKKLKEIGITICESVVNLYNKDSHIGLIQYFSKGICDI